MTMAEPAELTHLELWALDPRRSLVAGATRLIISRTAGRYRSAHRPRAYLCADAVAIRILWISLGLGRDERRELERRVAVRTREVERLAAESRYSSIVRERLQIARDLHDTLAHSMMAMLSEIRLMKPDPEAARFGDERGEIYLRIAQEALRNIERHAQATRSAPDHAPVMFRASS